MAITLTDLITQVRHRADMENGTFVSDTEITHYLNDEIKAVYSKMVNVDEGVLFATVSPTLTSVGDNSYALPSDFLRLVDVNIFTSARWTPSYPADPQAYYQLLSQVYTGDYTTEYFLHRNNAQDRYELFLFPAKDVSDIGVRYIPEADELSLGNDTLKWPSNWHLTIVVGAAAKCLIKEESDPTGLLFEKSEETKRVLKDIRAQKVAEIKTLRNIGNRGNIASKFRLPRLY